ncbi:ribosomal protein L25, Ctc-form [Tannerella forsythia KS16]|jgi:ribosomal protein L25, ctc-form|uniref:Large ribosomal subunit protein bL25 n=1 Tax=Tannerella forsythia TaxID=28112 RepID=A0A1D3UU26_TANFO|nr:50S ribosomal protein L25/general stress protein Ctc [Tannerella forsythia]BAR50139.1 ribosomal protein L25, Ctc-form [Tannerella forsythia 3313]BAR52971.1 ribosomal protein L25, Ctc-form [Tannerella forsythia KS16]SCQ23541.1 50S ribosomal protein L25 [Tannerella forsythia]SCQ24549.1 50S ribosomal protein L25 [Tannerella forsythia]
MKTFELKGTPRENLGKKMSKNLRKQGMIPAVLYGQEPVALPYTGKMNAGEKLVEIGDGKGIIVTDFSVSFDGVRKLIYTPEIHLVSIEMGDGRKVNAILKEIQFHAVSDAILHLDFQEVFADKPVEMHVPVELIGHAVGVKAGGKLTQAMRKLKVKGLAEQIPEKLTVNVDHLELGKTIKVGELQFDHVELISPKNAVVCAVKMTRAAQSAAGAAAAAEK